MRRPVSLTTVVTLLLVVAIGGVVWYTCFSPAIPSRPALKQVEDVNTSSDPVPLDPRLAYDSPFRNVKPDVAYVGTEKCLPCHNEIGNRYRSHPMGRSAGLVSQSSIVERYEEIAKHPVDAQGYHLKIEKTPDKVVHQMTTKNDATLPPYSIVADVAIGSGTRGRSYLTIDRGSVWQSPISWFSNESRWDVSPGFDLSQGGRRAISPGCLFCHVDQAKPIPHAENRYHEPVFPQMTAIGCERCHGPGALHVAERTSMPEVRKPDTSIVNPKHLSSALQSAVCEQCHLQGESRVARRGRSEFEYRPGLPFDEFVSVFVRHPNVADLGRSVGQFEQLEQSRCVTSSGGRLLCTTCHDPHGTPAIADRERFYREKCNTCHEKKPCATQLADRTAKQDNCIACHMTRKESSNIAHTSITDHRIFRRSIPASPLTGLPRGSSPLVPFRAGKLGPELERDQSIAIARLFTKHSRGPNPQQLLGVMACDRLTATLERWPGDVPAWVAMSQVRSSLGEDNARQYAAEKAVKLAPNSEQALAELAGAAASRGNYELAETLNSSLIVSNPSSVEPLAERAMMRMFLRRWSEAEADCRAALSIHPLHLRTRLILGVCLHLQGDPNAGRKQLEFAVMLSQDANQQRLLRDWYQRETR